jgi:hypothetical protein
MLDQSPRLDRGEPHVPAATNADHARVHVVDRRVFARRYVAVATRSAPACPVGATDVVIPIYHSDQIGALGRNLNADAAAGQKAGAGQSGRRTAGTVLIFSRN